MLARQAELLAEMAGRSDIDQAECQGGCKAAAQVCCGSLRAPEPFLQVNLDRAHPLFA